jgi:hypothetical protein
MFGHVSGLILGATPPKLVHHFIIAFVSFVSLQKVKTLVVTRVIATLRLSRWAEENPCYDHRNYSLPLLRSLAGCRSLFAHFNDIWHAAQGNKV